MFHYRSALDVTVSAAGALWLMSAGSGSVPDMGGGGRLEINKLSWVWAWELFPVIDWWPVQHVLSLAWWMLGSAPEPPTIPIAGQRNLLKQESKLHFHFLLKLVLQCFSSAWKLTSTMQRFWQYPSSSLVTICPLEVECYLSRQLHAQNLSFFLTILILEPMNGVARYHQPAQKRSETSPATVISATLWIKVCFSRPWWMFWASARVILMSSPNVIKMYSEIFQ